MGRLRQTTRTAASLVAILLAPAGCPLKGDIRPLTLYQKTARAALVVRARSLADTTRRPPMKVLEIFKGSCPHERLFIVPFVPDYANPKPWLQRGTFREGEEYFLFLDPYDPDPDDDAFPLEPLSGSGEEDLRTEYVLLNAHRGMIAIPAEGGEAIAAALRSFVKILTLQEYDLQAKALRALLREENPYLVEAGLIEVGRFELATEDEIETLLRLLSADRDDFRQGSLRLIGQIARTAASETRDLRRREDLLGRVAALAQADPSAATRLEAVRTLGSMGGDDAVSLLRAVGRQDASQEVRYQAQIILLEMFGGPDPPENRR